MLTTKITELTQLKNKLDEEKRMIDRKLSIINNLISTTWFIENSIYRQRISDRRIEHDGQKYKNRKRFA